MMRLRLVIGVAVLALACAWSWGSSGATRGTKKATARPKAAPAKPAPPVKLQVNGAPADGSALLVGGIPLLAVTSAASLVPVAPPVTVTKTPAGETTLTRPEAIVRIKPGAKQMYVDGQSMPLPTPAVERQGKVYLPVQVLQALYPDYRVALSYQAVSRTVQFVYEPKPAPALPVQARPPVTVLPTATPAAGPAAGGAACAPSSTGQGVATQEFGKPGAKVEIIALLPITHGCHVRTEAELKKAFEQHPNDVHLIIADLFGSDAPKYQQQVGGVKWTLVSINGKTNFDLNGRKIRLEMQEGRFYTPADLAPIVEQELRGK